MLSFRLGRFVPAAVLAASLGMMPGKALTLIDVSGPNEDNKAQATVLSNNLGVGFSLANAFNNVSISASLLSFLTEGNWNLVAYLTTQIGPGTNAVSHEVASLAQTITLPGSNLSAPWTITPVTIFSGLNLPAGNYFLTLSGTFNTNNAWWVSSPDADRTIVTAGGSAVTASEYFMGSPDSYLPASGFSSIGGFGYWFSVTGDPVDNNIPEPATAVLTLAGCLVLLHLRCSTPRQL